MAKGNGKRQRRKATATDSGWKLGTRQVAFPPDLREAQVRPSHPRRDRGGAQAEPPVSLWENVGLSHTFVNSADYSSARTHSRPSRLKVRP